MTTSPSPRIRVENPAEFIKALHEMRDALLKASLLLHDHLYETDAARREQAGQAADDAIRQAKSS